MKIFIGFIYFTIRACFVERNGDSLIDHLSRRIVLFFVNELSDSICYYKVNDNRRY